MFPPRTEDRLDFAVVGGGVAGLSTAWSLQRAGHRVAVFERRSDGAMAKCREGIRSPPSMTHVLRDWGIQRQLDSVSTPINQSVFLDAKSGKELGLIPVSDMMEHFPAEFRSLQYGDLFSVLYDLAIQAGVDLHFNTNVVSIDPSNATVSCDDGRHFSVDVIVGADGIDSIVRPVVLGPSAPQPETDNRFTVHLAVPARLARQHDDLAALMDERSWTGWFADGCSMHGVFTGPGPDSDYAIVMNIAMQGDDAPDEFPMSLDALRADLYDPRAQKLLKLADQLDKVVFDHHEPFDNWVHESGKVVLIGDAAHPTIPCGSHNYSACIEDATTLSALFSLPATKSQTPMLLSVFEDLRQPRCAAIQRYVRRKREVVTVPAGPGQRRRDELLRAQRAIHEEDEADDDFLYNTYSGFVQVNGFDAHEAVQDWWVTWGRSVLDRSPRSEREEDKVDEDGLCVVSVVVDVDVDVDPEGPTYPFTSDHTTGDDEHDAEDYRRVQR